MITYGLLFTGLRDKRSNPPWVPPGLGGLLGLSRFAWI